MLLLASPYIKHVKRALWTHAVAGRHNMRSGGSLHPGVHTSGRLTRVSHSATPRLDNKQDAAKKLSLFSSAIKSATLNKNLSAMQALLLS
jgi:hypothetical protein